MLSHTMKNIFSRTPKYLTAHVYQNKESVNLEKLTDSMLQNLRIAILEHWKTSSTSVLEFECEVYEINSWWRPAPPLQIEIRAYLRDAEMIVGKKKTRIPQLYLDKMLNRRFLLTPEDTVFQKWKAPVEVEFRRPA